MKKSTLLMIVSVVLAMTLSLGGTLAYLQDTDSDTNVMTLGNVQIEQHEFEREVDEKGDFVTYAETEREGKPTGYKLTGFTQAKPLYPAVGKVTGWDDTRVYFAQLPDSSNLGTMQLLEGLNNVQDKFVFVENTGKSDAYVRTLIAYEVGTAEEAFGDLIMASVNVFWKHTNIGVAEIDGNNYYLVEYLYDGNQYPEGGDMIAGGNAKHPDGIVHPDEYTYCNLAQIYMASKATNEDMKAIDGNKNGTYDIMVVSQAVQAAGFADAETALDAAFGDISANSHPWMDDDAEGDQDPDGIQQPVTVKTVAELQAALDAAVEGENTIVLGADIVGDVTVTQKANTKIAIYGGNHYYDGAITVDGQSKTYTTAGLTIENVNFKSEAITEDAVIRLGDNDDKTVTANTRYVCNVTVKNCTFDVVGAVGVKSYTGGSKNLVISNCEITERGYNFVNVAGIDNVLIEDSKSYSKNGINLNSSVNVTIRNCTINAHTGYAVRFGEGGLDTAAETYLIENSTLKAACTADDDAVIVFRGSANNATLTLKNVTTNGTREYYYKNNPNVNIVVE